MDVICPQCGTTYELDESQIQGKSVRVKCSACEYMFRVYRPTPSQIIPALQTWIVRSADGVISHVPDQSTLQRMIVERKVNRSDELSRDGRAWQLLGDVHDFRPFFAIVEEATTSSTMLQAVTGSGVAFSAVPAIQATTPEVAGVTPGLHMGHAAAHGGTEANTEAVGPAHHLANAVLLAGEMDPGSTLEFGLPGYKAESVKTDIGVPAAPAESSGYGQSVGVEVVQSEAARPMSDATEVAVEGISPSEADMVKASAVPVSLMPPKEEADEGGPSDMSFSSPTLPASTEQSQLVGGSGSQEMAVRVSPPTSTSFEGQASVSREPDDSFDLAPENDDDWFQGSKVELNASVAEPDKGASSASSQSFQEFDDERPGRADSTGSMDLNDGMRDFSSYSGEYYSDSIEDDFAIPQRSRTGLWIVVSVLGILLVVGGVTVLLPDLTARIAVSLGLRETTPAVMEKVKAAQVQLGGFRLSDFTKAQNLLTEAEQLHGGPFPSSLAARIEVELSRTEYRLYEMDLARKQQKFWEKKARLIDADIAKIPADDAEKDKKIAAFQQKKKAYQAQADTFERQRGEALAHYKKHWQAASKYRSAALQKDSLHPAVELAELHLYSLSADADKKFRPLYNKLLANAGKGQGSQADIQTRLFLMAAWVSLHQKQYSQSLNRIRKVIADRPSWIYPRLLQARAWAASERLDDATGSVQNLLQKSAKHPLGLAMSRYLKQMSDAAQAPQPRPVAAASPDPRGANATPGDRRTPAKPDARTAPDKRAKAPTRRRPGARRGSGGSYRSLMRIARRLRRNERYKSARRYYLRALKIKKSSRAYSGLGWCAMESSGGPSAAVKYFQQAMRVSSRNPDALFGLGMAYRRQRKTAKAKSTLKKFLSRFPRHRDAGEVRMILKALR